MYCSQCGMLASTDAKFCVNCGNPLGEISSEKSTADSISSVSARKPKIFWLYFLGALLGLTYFGMFIPALAGYKTNPQAGPGIIFLHGLFFRLLWKRHARKGWHGVLVGVAIGLLAFFMAGFISGFMRHGAGR